MATFVRKKGSISCFFFQKSLFRLFRLSIETQSSNTKSKRASIYAQLDGAARVAVVGRGCASLFEFESATASELAATRLHEALVLELVDAKKTVRCVAQLPLKQLLARSLKKTKRVVRKRFKHPLCERDAL